MSDITWVGFLFFNVAALFWYCSSPLFRNHPEPAQFDKLRLIDRFNARVKIGSAAASGEPTKACAASPPRDPSYPF
jgi:hypothetical protein